MGNYTKKIIGTIASGVGIGTGLLLAIGVSLFAGLALVLVTNWLVGYFCVSEEQLGKMRTNIDKFFRVTIFVTSLLAILMFGAPRQLDLSTAHGVIDVTKIVFGGSAICIAAIMGSLLGNLFRFKRKS